MTEKYSPYTWKTQKLSDDCETLECPAHDNYKDFKRDPSGYYVLIKVNLELLKIELAISDKDHTIVQIFRGQKSQDIYNAIFQYEKKNNVVWFQEKTHMAYLGKELKKAELALVMGNSGYYQE